MSPLERIGRLDEARLRLEVAAGRFRTLAFLASKSFAGRTQVLYLGRAEACERTAARVDRLVVDAEIAWQRQIPLKAEGGEWR